MLRSIEWNRCAVAKLDKAKLDNPNLQWHGWPPQVWNGKKWVYIEPAKLLAEQKEEIKRLRWIVDLRSGADG
jgi:hypothetical protein